MSFAVLMLWSSSVGYLWTFEAALVFQNKGTRFVRSIVELPSDGLIKLRTSARSIDSGKFQADDKRHLPLP